MYLCCSPIDAVFWQLMISLMLTRIRYDYPGNVNGLSMLCQLHLHQGNSTATPWVLSLPRRNITVRHK